MSETRYICRTLGQRLVAHKINVGENPVYQGLSSIQMFSAGMLNEHKQKSQNRRTVE